MLTMNRDKRQPDQGKWLCSNQPIKWHFWLKKLLHCMLEEVIVLVLIETNKENTFLSYLSYSLFPLLSMEIQSTKNTGNDDHLKYCYPVGTNSFFKSR